MTRNELSRLTEQVRNHLRSQMIVALTSDPRQPVDCPAFRPTEQRAVDAVLDHFIGGLSGTENLAELLRIAGLASSGEWRTDEKAAAELQLRASAWIAKIAAAHAEWHASDAVAAELGDDIPA